MAAGPKLVASKDFESTDPGGLSNQSDQPLINKRLELLENLSFAIRLLIVVGLLQDRFEDFNLMLGVGAGSGIDHFVWCFELPEVLFRSGMLLNLMVELH